MKRSGFVKKSYTEIAPKQREKNERRKLVPRKVKTPAKRTVAPHSARSRVKLPTPRSLQKKCDALLTPIIKLLYPFSIFSGQPTEVAHHHVHKSKSNALRYYLPNLIPLTHAEHLALHCNESYHASRIVAIRGIEWFKDIERVKQTTVHTDRFYYMAHLERLQKIHDELSTP